MPSYTIMIVTGDYETRQAEANEAGAVAYFEQHLDGNVNADVCGASAVVASNASEASKRWGSIYAHVIASVNPHDWFAPVVHVRGPGQAGYGNLHATNMPAIIGEAGHISHCGFREWLDVGGGVDVCAMGAALAIAATFPQGGLIALSVGHVGKVRSPNDTGAPACDNEDGDATNDNEGYYARRIIERIPYYLCGGARGDHLRDLRAAGSTLR